ncbi:hypothetical protein EMIT0111MI5_90108 [Burkholderia sp. IT-111MI5]
MRRTPDESTPLLLEAGSLHAVSDRFGSHPWTECGAPDTSSPAFFPPTIRRAHGVRALTNGL